MSTIIDASSSFNERPLLAPLKPKFTFLFISVISCAIFTALFFWLYFSVIESLPLRPSYGGYSFDNSYESRREFARAISPYIIWIGLTGLLQFGAFVCGAIAVSMFYYRAYSNLYKCEIKGLTISPGMAVAWFFIPLVNFVMPLIVSNQLTKASKLIKSGNYNGSWHNESVNPKVVLWYISAAGFFIYYIYCISQMMSTVLDMGLTYNGSIDRELAGAVAAIRFLKMVMIGYIVSMALQAIFLVLFTKEITEAHDLPSSGSQA